jgi:hypothetical protein
VIRRKVVLELEARPPDTIGDQLGLEVVDERLAKRVLVRVASGQNVAPPAPRKSDHQPTARKIVDRHSMRRFA